MSQDRRALALTCAALILLSLPALLDPGAPARGAALLDVAQSGHPFLSLAHAGLRLLWIPAVALSAMVMVLAPGLITVLSAGTAESAAQWLLQGLAVSTVLLSLAIQLLELIGGGPVRAMAFAAVAVATTIAAALAGMVRPRLRWTPGARALDVQVLAAAAAGAAILLVALEPKFLWETFNGDGAHAYEATRLLLHRPVPFWTAAAGVMSTYPGTTSFLSSYPMAWFVRLFGEIEASVRLPYLLFLAAGLYPALLMLIDAGRESPADRRPAWLLWPALAVYTVVMGFSATYNPYHADLALPATQDTLLIAWFLGFAWAFVARRWGWILVFAALTFTTSPGGLVLLGLWLIGAALCLRPMPLRQLVIAAGAVALCFILARLAPPILRAWGQAVPGSEHEAGGLAARLLNIQWRDWHRFVYVIVPAGILPAFSVFLVHKHDRLARTVAAVAVVQFAFFFVQRRMALHYFAPAMVLPLVVFWRTAPAAWFGRPLSLSVVAAAIVALLVSLPRDPGPQLAARPVGAAVLDWKDGYDDSRPSAFGRSELLGKVFPRDSHHAVPDSSYGGSPLSWFYYAHRAAPVRPAHYIIQDSAAPAPGGRLVATREGVALYVLDESALVHDLGLRPANSVARIYRIDKGTLFYHTPRQ